MLEEFRYRKRVKNLLVGEEAYLQVGSLFLDEKGREWLDVNSYVSRHNGGVIAGKVRRLADGKEAFELIEPDFITANAVVLLPGNSGIFKNMEGFLCLDSTLTVCCVSYPPKPKADHSQVQERRKILAPLYDVFMPQEILKEVLVHTNVPEITHGKEPVFNGVILYGRGGTGKTVLQKAIAEVYKNAGAHSVELNVASLSEKYIASLSNNLDARIGEVVDTASKMKQPAFVFLDEASSLVMGAEKHNESGADYYQEAVDVLKKYISNYPGLVFSVTTNMKPDKFDDTLVREGRLRPILIPYPGTDEKKRMWEHFLRLFDVLDDLDESQYLELAEAVPDEQGAFIQSFCKGYLAGKKLAMGAEASGSKNILDVLVSEKYITLEEVKEHISYETVLEDVRAAVLDKKSRSVRPVPGFIGTKIK